MSPGSDTNFINVSYLCSKLILGLIVFIYSALQEGQSGVQPLRQMVKTALQRADQTIKHTFMMLIKGLSD